MSLKGSNSKSKRQRFLIGCGLLLACSFVGAGAYCISVLTSELNAALAPTIREATLERPGGGTVILYDNQAGQSSSTYLLVHDLGRTASSADGRVQVGLVGNDADGDGRTSLKSLYWSKDFPLIVARSFLSVGKVGAFAEIAYDFKTHKVLDYGVEKILPLRGGRGPEVVALNFRVLSPDKS